MAVVNLELPLLIFFAGLVCGLVAWLLGTFTHVFREHRYRVTFGLIAFPLGGLMGFVSTLNAISVFGDFLAGKPLSVLLGIGVCGYLVFGFLGCWTAVRAAGRLDRKHTLSVLYNLVKEQKKHAQAPDRRQLENVQDAQAGGDLPPHLSTPGQGSEPRGDRDLPPVG
jgi:hypothetical protein